MDYNKLEMNATYRVTLHKSLIEADFSKSLTLIEQRVLYTAISNIPAPIFLKEKGQFVLDEKGKKIITNIVTELPKFKMSVKEFANLLGWKDVDYKKLSKVSGSLMEKVITVQDVDSDDIEQLHWVTYTRYMKGTGTVLIELHPRLLPYVANLTENFASVSLGEITGFKSKYSARLYFLLQQWAKVGNKTMELDEIRKILGVGFTEKDGKRVYKLGLFHQLRQRALEPAIEEINQYTDLNISYDEIIEGQKVTSVTFHIEKTNKKVEITKKPEQPKAEPKTPKVPEPLKTPETIYDEIAQSISHLNFNKEAYTNIAKRLMGIENIESIKDHVIKELNRLAAYIEESGNLGAGFAIKEVEKAVMRFTVEKDFNFNDLIDGAKSKAIPQGKNKEIVPDWFYKQKEEQAAKTPVETPVTTGEIDFEAERAKILAMLGKTAN